MFRRQTKSIESHVPNFIKLFLKMQHIFLLQGYMDRQTDGNDLKDLAWFYADWYILRWVLEQ